MWSIHSSGMHTYVAWNAYEHQMNGGRFFASRYVVLISPTIPDVRVYDGSIFWFNPGEAV